MVIKRIVVKGLNNHIDLDCTFFPDVNIFTGRNGAGKTTLLKLLWYSISGNIEYAVQELSFRDFELETSEYTLAVSNASVGATKKEALLTISLTSSKGEKILDNKREAISSPQRMSGVTVANRYVSRAFKQSVFFPTFRRIEGGYGISDERYASPYERDMSFHRGSQIQIALEGLSEQLSVGGHKFVSSISTSDLRLLLNSKYAELTSQVNQYSKELTDSILNLIRYNDNVIKVTGEKPERSEAEALGAAKQTLDDIKTDISKFEAKKGDAFRPFLVLQGLIAQIFEHKGIRLSETLVFGDREAPIESSKLSAGEKQMLSFLCYNAFCEGSAIFVDEPELSLHVDWQRALIGRLLKQETNNQFFIATHSPFIYTQYSDKEIVILNDRGDSA